MCCASYMPCGGPEPPQGGSFSGGICALAPGRDLWYADGEGGRAVEKENVLRDLGENVVNALLSASQDGCAYVNDQGVIVYCNPAYERITGIRREQLIGYSVYELVKLGFPVSELTIRVHETCRPHSQVIRYSPAGNEILVTSTPVFDEKTGVLLGSVTNFRDLTDLNNSRAGMELTDLEYRTMLAQKEDLLDRLRARLSSAELDMSSVGMVGRSKAVRNLVELASRIASVGSTVLITGESGVGKDVFCRLVHHLGNEKLPYVKISCAAIPENLLESELFGYEPGAFTGASRRGKAGILEQAEDGSVFLDEVGTLPMHLQSKLLSLLQDRWYYRVGGTRQIPLRARIMAATNEDLKQAVAAGTFRGDLYYRLNVIPVHIPPLRERIEDVPLLVDDMLRKLNTSYNAKKVFSNDAMAAFKRYAWPGNVRELTNVVERMYVLTPGEVIGVEMLPPELSAAAVEALPDILGGDKTLKTVLAQVEKRLLWETLQSDRRLQDIADSLGISLSSLERKARQYGLPLRYRKGAEEPDRST